MLTVSGVCGETHLGQAALWWRCEACRSASAPLWQPAQQHCCAAHPASPARVERSHRMQMQHALMFRPPLVQLAGVLLCLVLRNISSALSI